MNEKAAPDISIGLSAEERAELTELITVLRTDKSPEPSETAAPGAEPQLKTLQQQLSHYSEIILNFDARLKSLYEIVCLFDAKSTIMNERINSIANSIATKAP